MFGYMSDTKKNKFHSEIIKMHEPQYVLSNMAQSKCLMNVY